MSVPPRKIKVLGFGAALLDILARVDDSFIDISGGAKGGMVMVDTATQNALVSKLDSCVRAMGGSAANTVAGLQRLGIPTALLAKVGRDSDGVFYESEFARSGGDVRSFKHSDSDHTGRCLSLVTPDSERTMRSDLGASAKLVPDDVQLSDFEGVTHVHIEGYQLFNFEAFEKVLKLAKASGATVSLDLASFEVVKIFRDKLDDILDRYVDIVFANEDEAAAFLGDDSFSPEAAADRLFKLCNTTVVKLGRKGACMRNSRESGFIRVSAELVKAIDTTGAGDLWQAGFLYGFLNGCPLEVCGKMGSLLGAEIVQVMGAAIPEKRWPEIIQKFNNLEG